MGEMSWLAYLVDTQNEKELIELLSGKGFRNPNFAAKEFLKAGNQIKEEKKKKKTVSIREINKEIAKEMKTATNSCVSLIVHTASVNVKEE